MNQTIPSENDSLKQLYVGQLTQRFLTQLKAKQLHLRKSYQKKHWLSSRVLAERSGLGYEAVVRYIIRRDRPITINVLDRLMYASNITILDLLTPSEILSHLESLDYTERNKLRNQFKKLLDTRDEQVSNGGSVDSADSQAQSR